MSKRTAHCLAARSRSLVFLGLLSSIAYGEQSLRLSQGFWASTTIPDSAPYSALDSSRIEFRVHDWQQVSGYVRLLAHSILDVYFPPNADQIVLHDWVDDFAGLGGAMTFDISGRADFVMRFQRDTVNKRITGELWNADGSNYHVSTMPIANVVHRTYGGDWNFGGSSPSLSCSLAFFRWYSTLLPLGLAAPHGSGGGDLADWEFEGNGTDSSSHRLNLTMNGGSAVYVATRVYPPAADAGDGAIVRAGYPARLDASRSYPFVGNSIAYFWQQLLGPTRVFWSDRRIATPVITGLVFGDYTFKVTVTDEMGQNSSATVQIGAVATDSSGRVISADASLDRLLGPELQAGLSPWPWFDDRHRKLAGFFGALLSTDVDFQDEWNVPLAGTISVTNASPVVTGSGTQFQTDFCGGPGNTSPVGRSGPSDAHYQFVVWYPYASSAYGRVSYGVQSCDSQTQITLETAYNTSVNANGVGYARWYCLGCWIGGGDNRNYYDNVLAHYALYYRTGLAQYRDYARTLADRWWGMPYIDEGRCMDRGGCPAAPRVYSLTGMVARALDGRPEMWPGIRKFLDNAVYWITRTSGIGDIREEGYQVSQVSLGALFDPDQEKRASYTQALEQSIVNKWAPQQKPGGQWENPTWGYAPWNGWAGTVTVTNGSTTVTGSGTNWPNDVCGENFFWVADVDGSNGDPVAYHCTRNSAAQVTLDRPYEGTSASGKGWQFNNLVGRGTQPFMMGVVGTGWHWAYLALQAASSSRASQARQFVIDAANWLKTYGYSPAMKGLYYGRNYPNCEPSPDSVPNCAADRFLNSETMNTFSQAYLFTGDQTYKDRGDTMFGAVWGGPNAQGPGADGIWTQTYDDGGWTMATKKAKDYGFAFGLGLGSSWPAARLGAIAGSQGRQTAVGFDLGGVQGATHVRIILRKPDGGTVQSLCQASPCTVTVDEREGDHLMRLEYLSADDRVLARGDWTLIAIR